MSTVSEGGVLGSKASRGFLVAAALWIVGLFALLRVPAVQQHVLLPLTQGQAKLATIGQGAPRLPVLVTLECSGADVIALLLAAVFAYPASWRRRLAGAAGGLAVLLTLNTLRIASLSQAAGTPAFGPLHLTIWPTVLVLATLAYAAAWMWAADARPSGGLRLERWLPFAATAAVLVCAFMLCLPRLSHTQSLRGVTGFFASTAVWILGGLGLAASAHGSSLITRQGAFLVTPECVLTPLMPVYLAAAFTLPRRWRVRGAALAAFVPVFALLAMARLFTVALPPAIVQSPMVAIHGFYQFLIGTAVVALVAWRAGSDARPRSRAARLALAAAAVAVAAAAPYRALLVTEATALANLLPHTLTRLAAPRDEQGALLLLPSYQLALMAALWLAADGWRRAGRLAAGLGVLHLGHLLLLVGLGELALHAATEAPVTLVRAWAVAAPLALFWALRRRPRAPEAVALPSPAPA